LPAMCDSVRKCISQGDEDGAAIAFEVRVFHYLILIAFLALLIISVCVCVFLNESTLVCYCICAHVQFYI
jgi:hypothetical protein